MKLLPAQSKAVWTLLRRLYEQAEAAKPKTAAPDSDGKGGLVKGLRPKAPSLLTDPWDEGAVSFNTYTIAGTRGAGKTTALRAVQAMLPYLGSINDRNAYDRFETMVQGPNPEQVLEMIIPSEIRDAFRVEGQPPENAAGNVKDLFRAHPANPEPHVYTPRGMRSALALPIIDPTHFEEERRTVMEQVIALLSHVIEQGLDCDGEDRGRRSSSWLVDAEARQDGPREQRLRRCLERLRGEISRGWVFAQEFGQKMLIDDSASFDEFVASRAERSVDAALRHKRWRELVDDVLDCFDARLLVISFDDCDLAPQNTIDVMDAIRIYLSSPKIAVILATDFREVRNNLHVARLASLNKAARSASMGSKETIRRFGCLIEDEFNQVELFLDKVVPKSNRLYIHLTSYHAGLELLPGRTFPARDVALLKGDYGHIFSFLTPRDVSNIRRMVARGDRKADVIEVIALSTSASDVARRTEAMLDQRFPIKVRLSRARSPFLKIRAEAVEDGEEDDTSSSLNLGGQGDTVSGLWALTEPVEEHASNDHAFDRAEALRGIFLAFIVDRRRADQNLKLPEMTISFVGLPGVFTLPPVRERDEQQIVLDPEGLLADLENFTGLPRNCRSLSAAARLLKERTNVVRPTRYLFDEFVNFEGLSRMPEPRGSKLSFAQLSQRALRDDRSKQDLLYRLMGVGAAAVTGSPRILDRSEQMKVHVRANLEGVANANEALTTFTVNLSQALEDSRAAISLLGEAGRIFANGVERTPLAIDDGTLDGLLSHDGDPWSIPDRILVSALETIADLRTVPGRSQTWTLRLDASERDRSACRELLFAVAGPLAVLRRRFGAKAVEVLVARARALWKLCYEGIPAECLLPKAGSDPAPEQTGERSFPLEEGEIDWSVFGVAGSKTAARFLVVPEALLKVLLEQL